MLTAPLFKHAIRNLKNTIKGRALASRQMRQKANRLIGMDKHHVHLEMREYGAGTRNYLLAYALIRGIPYKTAEPACHPGNEPGAYGIQNALAYGLKLPDGLVDAIWDARQILAWLEAEPEGVRAAA
jgi:hypothetical protein